MIFFIINKKEIYIANMIGFQGLKDLYRRESEPFRDQIKKLNGPYSVKPKTVVSQIQK